MLHEKKKILVLAPVSRRITIRDLVPHTLYLFEISAKYSDDGWGPKKMLWVETISDGQ